MFADADKALDVAGDGVVADMLKIAGDYRGKQGVFKFIKEPNEGNQSSSFKPNPVECFMSAIWSERIDSVLSRGIFLDGFGVRNWALSRDKALRAIDELEDFGVAILGGDVYLVVGEIAEQTYDSWYCDQGLDEPESVFFKRSLDKARDYVCGYSVQGGLFSLVPKIQW